MKNLIVMLLVAVVVISTGLLATAAEQKYSDKVIAYYFHGSFRCSTCHKIEQYSREAIETNFKDPLASGKLVFKVVNIEDKGNEHYGRDYQLYTKSLILSLIKDGNEKKRINLNKIWEYVGNKERFIDYVKSGITDLMKDAQ